MITKKEKIAKEVGKMMEQAVLKIFEDGTEYDDDQQQRRVVVFLPARKEEIEQGILHRYVAILVDTDVEKSIIVETSQLESNLSKPAVYFKEIHKYAKYLGARKLMDCLITKIYGE